ncbi:hypothetical protein N7527_008782 [Penicillium freii]|nr:hypothetical protein N7527_008782 [Penicillium freii]
METMKKSRPNLKLEAETDILFAEELLVPGTDQEVKILTHPVISTALSLDSGALNISSVGGNKVKLGKFEPSGLASDGPVGDIT